MLVKKPSRELICLLQRARLPPVQELGPGLEDRGSPGCCVGQPSAPISSPSRLHILTTREKLGIHPRLPCHWGTTDGPPGDVSEADVINAGSILSAPADRGSGAGKSPPHGTLSTALQVPGIPALPRGCVITPHPRSRHRCPVGFQPPLRTPGGQCSKKAPARFLLPVPSEPVPSWPRCPVSHNCPGNSATITCSRLCPDLVYGTMQTVECTSQPTSTKGKRNKTC